MIDKIVRYVWIDENHSDSEYAIIPKAYQICIMSAVVMNPDYQVVIHTNKPLLWDDLLHETPHIKNEIIPEAYFKMVDSLGIKRVAHKSDYIRYSILYKQGGIYSDTDVFMIRSLDDLLDNRMVLAREKPATICCAFMMNEPGHELFADVLEKYRTDYQPDEWLYNSQRVLRNEAKKYDDINILEYEKGFFYPNFKPFPMCMLYDNYPINSIEDIHKKFKCYSHHIWSSTPYGDKLKAYINENCIGVQNPEDKSYIAQLIGFIYREYYKLVK